MVLGVNDQAPDGASDGGDAPTTTIDRPETGLKRLLSLWWVPYVVLAVFAGGYTVHAQVEMAGPYSHFDEYQYYDYLEKLPSQGFVKQGEKVGEEARRVASCEGYLFFGQIGVACDAPQEPDSAFLVDGYNSADIYTPAYFAPTWVMAQPFTWFGMDLLDAGRAVGGIWLFLGLAAIFALQRRLGVDPRVALGVTLIVLALPATYWATQFISTDAPTYLIIGLLGLVGVRFASGRGRLWELPAMSAVAVAFKINNLGGIGMVLLALLIFVVWGRRSRPTEVAPGEPTVGRAVLATVLSGVAVLAVYGGWLVLRAATSLGVDADVDEHNKVAFTAGKLLDEMMGFIGSVGTVRLPIATDTWPRFVEAGFPVLGVGALAIALVASGPMMRARRSIGWGVLGGVLAFGPALTLMMVALTGEYVALSGRYSIIFVAAYTTVIGLVGHQVKLRGGLVLGVGAAVALVNFLV